MLLKKAQCFYIVLEKRLFFRDFPCKRCQFLYVSYKRIHFSTFSLYKVVFFVFSPYNQLFFAYFHDNTFIFHVHLIKGLGFLYFPAGRLIFLVFTYKRLYVSGFSL